MTTTSRLLRLLSLLQTRRDWPGSVLASRLEVSDRTVRRDIGRLREMGYAIGAAMGPDGGYRLAAGQELPPLLFDDDQAVAVAIALRTAPAAGAEIEEAAARALGTIRQIMPSRLRHRLDALEVTPVSRPGDVASTRVSRGVLVTLSDAIRAREVLRFDYAAGDDASSTQLPPRRAEPHHLVASDGRWYLVAWDLDREDWRVFRIDRIRPRRPNGPRFAARTVPGGDVQTFVAARFRGSAAGGWPCHGSVILHAPAQEIVPFAGDGSVTAIDEQTCRLDVGSWSWIALAASLGRFDVAMDVVGPAELSSAFATLAGRYAATSVS